MAAVFGRSTSQRPVGARGGAVAALTWTRMLKVSRGLSKAVSMVVLVLSAVAVRFYRSRSVSQDTQDVEPVDMV